MRELTPVLVAFAVLMGAGAVIALNNPVVILAAVFVLVGVGFAVFGAVADYIGEER